MARRSRLATGLERPALLRVDFREGLPPVQRLELRSALALRARRHVALPRGSAARFAVGRAHPRLRGVDDQVAPRRLRALCPRWFRVPLLLAAEGLCLGCHGATVPQTRRRNSFIARSPRSACRCVAAARPSATRRRKSPADRASPREVVDDFGDGPGGLFPDILVGRVSILVAPRGELARLDARPPRESGRRRELADLPHGIQGRTALAESASTTERRALTFRCRSHFSNERQRAAGCITRSLIPAPS